MKKNGKYCSGKKGFNMKPLAVLLALTLLVGCAVGGTLAWLTAKTTDVKNTFSPSDITIALNESDNLDLKMIPGHTITKDPWAKVETGSEDCYLFVQITESENFGSYMTYDIADGWTKLEDGVYYRVFDSKDDANTNVMGTQYPILKDNQVKVKDTVTKENMNALTAASYPTLTFKAYAVQLYKDNSNQFSAEEAWAKRPTT